MYYTVQPGDNLWSIANRFGTTHEAIMEANHLASTNLQVGQRLYIPIPPHQMPTPGMPPVQPMPMPPAQPMPPMQPPTPAFPAPGGIPGMHFLQRLDQIERRLTHIEQRLERLERRVNRLEQQHPRQES